MAAKKFSKADAPWIEETAWIFMAAGFFKQFKNDAKLVPNVVKAFEKAYGRPPVWNTPYENERLLSLDTERASLLPLLDLDRQPPLEGLYAKALTDWARISAGSFPARKVRERWDTKRRKVQVDLHVRGAAHTLTPRVYRHGQFDMSILRAVNKLVAKPYALHVIRTDNALPGTLVVALRRADATEFQVHRGIRVFAPADFAKMKSIFTQRERDWAAEDED